MGALLLLVNLMEAYKIRYLIPWFPLTLFFFLVFDCNSTRAKRTANSIANFLLTYLQVIILQTYWRRWLAKNYVQRLREDHMLRIEWERQEELRKQRERAERIKREWERRMNPKTKEDFDLLFAHLESELVTYSTWPYMCFMIQLSLIMTEVM